MAIDFVEAHILQHLDAQYAIDAKPEESERRDRHRIPMRPLTRINVGDYILWKSNIITKEDESARELLILWIGPYKVIWQDATVTLYQLDLGRSCFQSYEMGQSGNFGGSILLDVIRDVDVFKSLMLSTSLSKQGENCQTWSRNVIHTR